MPQRAANRQRDRENARDLRHKRRVAKSSPGSKRLVAFGALALVVLALAGYFLWPVLKPKASAGPGTVVVQMSMSGFDPNRIEARAGQPITVRLVNMDSQFHTDGGGWHQFASDGLAVDVKVPPLKTQEFTFTPDKSGEFEVYCDVCCGGRENPYMVATIVVKS
ncbi:MAG: cupredoxin domain-containing protein [Chloroflexi bacterium]|nr:cupredoxin domain-containing protein [Chloroflexota bacterium]